MLRQFFQHRLKENNDKSVRFQRVLNNTHLQRSLQISLLTMAGVKHKAYGYHNTAENFKRSFLFRAELLTRLVTLNMT